jgi:hypothetical protein
VPIYILTPRRKSFGVHFTLLEETPRDDGATPMDFCSDFGWHWPVLFVSVEELGLEGRERSERVSLLKGFS